MKVTNYLSKSAVVGNSAVGDNAMLVTSWPIESVGGRTFP